MIALDVKKEKNIMQNAIAINVIKDRIIRFVLVEADNLFAGKSSIEASTNNDESTQITVVNNKKVYNLLENTWRKRQQKLQNENIKC